LDAPADKALRRETARVPAENKLQKIKRLGLNARQEKAIKFLLRTGAISVGEYQAVTSCIRRTAQRDLEDMRERGIIKAVAKSKTDPTRHYVLL